MSYYFLTVYCSCRFLLAKMFLNSLVLCIFNISLQCVFLEYKIPQKVFEAVDNVPHVYSIAGLQEYGRNFNFCYGFFLRADKTAARCSGLAVLCCRCSSKKSSRHENCCQMLKRLFGLFQYSRNTP